jgi:hypothetical protein
MVDLKIHLQANLSAEERSAEMKRRAVVRAKNAKRKKKK